MIFVSLFRRRFKESFRIYWSSINDPSFRTASKYPTRTPCIFIPTNGTLPGCNSQGRCDYQGIIGVSNALLRGCNNCAGYWLLLVVLVNPSRTSTCTRMDADRDKRAARKNMYFDRYSPVNLEMLLYGAVEKNKT